MYHGICENEGKRISDSDAFSYACECIENGVGQEQETFMELARDADSFRDFAESLVEWFYSGSWIHSF